MLCNIWLDPIYNKSQVGWVSKLLMAEGVDTTLPLDVCISYM